MCIRKVNRKYTTSILTLGLRSYIQSTHNMCKINDYDMIGEVCIGYVMHVVREREKQGY